MTELDPNGQSSERISHFENIVKNSPDIFFIYDPHTARVIYCNNRVTPVLGYSCDEFQSMQLDGPGALLHPEDHPSFKVCLEQIFNAGSDNVGEFFCRCVSSSESHCD